MQPQPGSAEELATFRRLQQRLEPMFERLFRDERAPRSVVVVPSLSLDVNELEKLTGVLHYEERMLCLLMLLRFPRTRVTYVTSQPIHPSIIDYYLQLLPGIPGRHARNRLTLLDCDDGSIKPLTQKILERPRLIERMRGEIADPQWAHMTCFNATGLERSLAVQLGIPLYACDPDLVRLGTKSVGRELLRSEGILVPPGHEHLRDGADVTEALTDLRARNPQLDRAVVKLNDSFSGEGNAVFRYEGAPEGDGLGDWVRREIPTRLDFESADESWDAYLGKLADMGGIVEEFIEGADKRSPSVQCRIDPLRRVDVVSTHDQVLGGPTGQVFLGATFPADEEYRLDIQGAAARVANRLAAEGVLGRFSLDFVSVRREGKWCHYALEMNLRKGGTTLPFLMLQFLTDGEYDPETGIYLIPTGRPRYYYSSDNVEKVSYRGLTPDDLIDIMVDNGLHFDASRQQGVVFHLIGALSRYGKLGTVCIGHSPKRAEELFHETVATLDRET